MEFATFYVGPGPAPHIEACLRSWSNYGHSIVVYTYDSRLAMPPGVERRDANEIISSDQLYVYRSGAGAGSVAAFSNEFRYRMVMTTGRVWVDTDVLCLSDEWPDAPYLLAWESAAADRCNNAVFSAPSDSELVSRALELVLRADRSTVSHGELGPGALTEVIGALDLNYVVRDFRDFYALSHHECRMFLDPAAREAVEARTASSLSLHLWDEVWTRARFPTFMRPPRGSYLEAIYERHGVEVPVMARIEDPSILEFRGEEAVVPEPEYRRLREWALEMEGELLKRDLVDDATGGS